MKNTDRECFEPYSVVKPTRESEQYFFIWIRFYFPNRDAMVERKSIHGVDMVMKLLYVSVLKAGVAVIDVPGTSCIKLNGGRKCYRQTLK